MHCVDSFKDIGQYKSIRQEIEEGKPPSAKIVEVTRAQADELMTLFMAHELKNCGLQLAFVNEEPPPGAKNAWLHVAKRGTPPTAKLIPCLALGDSPPTLPAVATKKVDATSQEEAAILRVTCDKQYISEDTWKKACGKPANAFHCVVEKRGVAKHIVSTYGWRILTASGLDDQISGFVKVDNAFRSNFLSMSGIEGWFIDSLAKHGPKPAVEWIAPAIDESRSQYRERVVSEANDAGVALRQGKGVTLGIRAARPDSSKPRPANWQIEGAPRSWSSNKTCDFLTANGWKDVTPISSGWVFRALAPDTALCHVYEIGECTIVVHLATPRTINRKQKLITRAGSDIRPAASKWAKASGISAPTDTSKQVAPTQIDVDEHMEKQEEGKRASSQPTGQSPEKKKLRSEDKKKSIAEPFGFTQLDLGGQGDCAYRAAAVAYALATDRPLEEAKQKAKALGATLRAQVASHLKKHEHFKDTWLPDKRWTLQTEGGAVPKTYKEWLEATARPQRWACGPTLIGIATRLQRNLIILKFDNNEWNKVAFITPFENMKECQTAKQFPPLPLLLKDKHYTTLLPSAEGWPASWNSTVQDQAWDANEARGGGKSSTSVGSWLPASSSAGTKKTIQRSTDKSFRRQPGGNSCASWLPPCSFGQATTKANTTGPSHNDTKNLISEPAHEDFTEPEPFAGDSTAVSSSAANKRQRTAKTSWTCPECGYHTGETPWWNKRKQSHINSWHPDMKATFGRPPKQALVEWNSTCVWKCPLCSLGMPPSYSGDQRGKIRKEHGLTSHPTADQKIFQINKSVACRPNAVKASLAKISAGIAKRLVDIKAGKQGDHEVQFLPLPPNNDKRKKKRGFLNCIFCKKCRAIASSIKLIAKVRCDCRNRAGPKRAQLLARLRDILAKKQLPETDLDKVQYALNLLLPEEQNSEEREPHDIAKMPWPLSSPAKLFICKRCTQISTSRSYLARTACTSTSAWGPNKGSLLRKLDVAYKSARGQTRDRINESRNILCGKAKLADDHDA